jgi:hypothetical protein
MTLNPKDIDTCVVVMVRADWLKFRHPRRRLDAFFTFFYNYPLSIIRMFFFNEGVKRHGLYRYCTDGRCKLFRARLIGQRRDRLVNDVAD